MVCIECGDVTSNGIIMTCSKCIATSKEEFKISIKNEQTMKYMTLEEFLKSDYGDDDSLSVDLTLEDGIPSYVNDHDHYGIHFCEEDETWFAIGVDMGNEFTSYDAALKHLIKSLGK